MKLFQICGPLVLLFSPLVMANELPIISIFTDKSISRDNKTLGSAHLNGDSFTIGIRQRGASSKVFPKKQFSLEFWEDKFGKSRNVSLFDLPEENDFVLNGPYVDGSLIRNTLTYELARQLGFWAPRTQFVELVLNQKELGLYVLTEKIKRDKNRLNIPKVSKGGFLFELGGKDLKTHFGTEFNLKYPKSNKIKQKHKNYLKALLDIFEADIISKQKNLNHMDVPSFVDFFIMQEFTKNSDGFRRSLYLHVRDGKVFAGPLWDFNLAYGNIFYFDGNAPKGWMYKRRYFIAGFSDPVFWWRKLMKRKDFRQLVKKRWKALRESVLSLENIYGVMDSQAKSLTNTPQLDDQLWSPRNTLFTEAVGFNPYPRPITFEGHVHKLKSWIKYRLVWLDQAYEKL